MNDNFINSEQSYNPQLPNQQINPQFPNQQINPQPVPEQYIPPPVNDQSIVLQSSDQKYKLIQSVNIQYIPLQAPQSNHPQILQLISQQVPGQQVQPAIQQNEAQSNVRNAQLSAAIPAGPAAAKNLNFKVNLNAPIAWTWFYFILELIVVFLDIANISSRTKIGQVKSVVIFFSIAYLVTKSGRSNDVVKYNTALLIFVLYVIFYSGIFIYVYFIVKDFTTCYNKSQNTDILIFQIEKGLDLITICILCCYKKEFNKLQKKSN